MRVTYLGTSLWVSLLLLRTLEAQAAKASIVPDVPHCATCAVRMRQLVTLGTVDGPASIPVGIHSVSVDAAGRYWVLSGEDPPLVFDSVGGFVTRVGGKGRGPGEYVRPVEAVSIGGDSTLVVDGGSGRATVIGRDLAAVRAIEFSNTLVPLLVLSWPELLVGNGNISTPSASGWPLHRISFATGKANLLSSFGPDDGELKPYEFRRLSQLLALSAPGTFWAADQLRYRIVRWTSDGNKLQTLERRPKWFAGPSDFGLGSPTTPPKPGISAVIEDSSGLLWVFVRMPAKTWREAWPSTGSRSGEYEYRSIALDKLFTTTIEVIDPKAGRVVTRRSLEQFVVSALPGSRAATYGVDAEGVVRVSILQLTLSKQ